MCLIAKQTKDVQGYKRQAWVGSWSVFFSLASLFLCDGRDWLQTE